MHKNPFASKGSFAQWQSTYGQMATRYSVEATGQLRALLGVLHKSLARTTDTKYTA